MLDAEARRRLVARVRAALRALGRARSSTCLVQELAGETDPAGAGIALGDIVNSLETAPRRAPGKRLITEAERLAIHGLCHLFGHDHKRPAEAKVMFALERRLRRLKI